MNAENNDLEDKSLHLTEMSSIDIICYDESASQENDTVVIAKLPVSRLFVF